MRAKGVYGHILYYIVFLCTIKIIVEMFSGTTCILMSRISTLPSGCHTLNVTNKPERDINEENTIRGNYMS